MRMMGKKLKNRAKIVRVVGNSCAGNRKMRLDGFKNRERDIFNKIVQRKVLKMVVLL